MIIMIIFFIESNSYTTDVRVHVELAVEQSSKDPTITNKTILFSDWETSSQCILSI